MDTIDNDLIVQKILDFEHDFVSTIEIVDPAESLYENPEEFKRERE